MKTSEILNKYQFHIKKKFGQNFLTSDYILSSIVNAAELNENVGVIEIGPGLGALTNYIAKHAKKVLCYEIDTDLLPILEDTLSEYDNVKIINQDILEADVNRDIEKYLPDCQEIYVIANLPYYITTPILLTLLERVSRIKKYIVMMQLEVANRLAGKTKTKEYNSLSIAIQYRATVKKVLNVPRNVFIPAPNVDSAVLEIKTYDKQQYFPKKEWFFFDVVRSAFVQRRKTLINNLINRFGPKKEIYEDILKEINLKTTVRSEELSIDDFVRLSDLLLDKLSSKELIDIVDEFGLPTGKIISRGDNTSRGEYTKIVMAVIKSNDEFLIQKRSNYKINYPGIWALTGGAVLSGEENLDAIKREINEELNLSCLDIRLDKTVKSINQIRYFYTVEVDKNEPIILDFEEVSEAKWINVNDLKKYRLSFFKDDYKYLIEYFGLEK